MSRKTKTFLWIIFALIVIGGGAWALMASNGSEEEEGPPTVEVTRGDIIDKALAVGTIEPRVEVSVKSQFSGVVKREYAEAGDFVKAGAVLLEVQPNPTPTELVEAERRIELRELEVNNLKTELDRLRQMYDKKLVSAQEYERAKREYDEAALQLQISQEQLALMREGKIATNKGSFETVVRAPVSGYVLDKMIEIGDPVVPLTSYQEGTVLMTMANMEDLIFRGTVDEIDVGRLLEGMSVDIKVGALPDATVTGLLAKIWLKATKEENSTVFPVEIEISTATRPDLQNPEGDPIAAVLRAGYSANAEIIIERHDNVLLIPERVIEFSGDTARVMVHLNVDESEERIIYTGLSDAINTEVISGLEEGDKLREKPPKEIE
jgi:HlyD family secretion protein